MKYEYPALYKSVKQGYVVLASSSCRGMVVYATETSIHKLGTYLDCWISFDDVTAWTRCRHPITLTDE